MSEIDTVGTPPVDVEEVVGSVEEVFDALAQTMPALLDPNPSGPDQGALEQTVFQGAIAVIGPEPVTIIVDTEGTTAARLAVGWSLAGPEGPTIADATDAMGEFVNIVGGAVKATFDAESSLGLPAIEVLDAAARSSDPSVIIIDHPIGRIDIRVTRD